MLKEGTKAPAFTLDTARGDRLSLSEVLSAGNHVVLVFMRYLG